MPTPPQYGEPMNLNPHQGDALVDAKRIATNELFLSANRHTESFPKNLSDPELERRALVDSLAKDQERVQVAMKWQEKHSSSNTRSPIGKILDALQKAFLTQEQKNLIEVNSVGAQAVIEKAKAHQDRLHELQEIIQSDPSILERVKAHAHEEAQILQRLALHHAIKYINHDNPISDADVARYVQMYNEGELRLESNDYQKATGLYDMSIALLQSELFAVPALPESRERRAANRFFDPRMQVKGAE